MKTLLSLLLLLLPPVLASSAEIPWRTDYDQALQEAREAGKPLLLDFSAAWCGPCRHMEATTFADSDVQRALTAFIPVRLDFDRNPKLVGQYHVRGIPALFLLNRFGEQVATQIGALHSRGLLEWLAKSREGAMATVSRESAAQEKLKGLARDLTSAVPAERQRGLDQVITSYLKKDHFAASAESLLLLQISRAPQEALSLLNDPHLGIRILFANAWSKEKGGAIAFDPWAAPEARADALRQLSP